MDEDFRGSVQNLAKDALHLMRRYFKGDAPADAGKVGAAMRAVGMGVKIEHMNQLKDHGDKSLALRVMNFLPKDEKTRSEYLKITNPEVAPLLLPRPKKKKK